MKIELLAEAVEDLVEGHHFYEEQQSGLGAYFLESLYADISSLQLYAGIHRKAYGDLHRMLSKRFPYAVFYTFTGNTVYIRAVVDCRRNPAWIRKKLK